ncbi:MAG: hypothetical protein ACHQNT_13435 [Bacteroidia bacterium]
MKIYQPKKVEAIQWDGENTQQVVLFAQPNSDISQIKSIPNKKAESMKINGITVNIGDYFIRFLGSLQTAHIPKKIFEQFYDIIE